MTAIAAEQGAYPSNSLRSGNHGDVLARRLSVFVQMSERDRTAIDSATGRGRPVGPHVDLIREGAVPEDSFLVLEGFACRYRHRSDGRRQILSLLLPGDLCDVDMASMARMDHTIGTLSPCRVARIPREAMAALVEQHPRIDRALRFVKLAEEATMREWLVDLGGRSAVERIAHLLCEIMARLYAVGLATQDSCGLPITQADLADSMGLSIVHVNRTLKSLKGMGLIGVKGRRLVFLNRSRLVTLSEFRPDYLNPALAKGQGTPVQA